MNLPNMELWRMGRRDYEGCTITVHECVAVLAYMLSIVLLELPLFEHPQHPLLKSPIQEQGPRGQLNNEPFLVRRCSTTAAAKNLPVDKSCAGAYSTTTSGIAKYFFAKQAGLHLLVWKGRV